MLRFRRVNLRLTVGAKIFAGFLVVLATFGAVFGFAVWRIAQVGDQLRANQTYLALALKVNDLDKTEEQLSRVVVSRKERTLYWRKMRRAQLAEAERLARAAERIEVADRLATLDRE